MKKNLFLWGKWRTKSYLSAGLLFVLVLIASCANGFDDHELFSAGVTNTQLKSPIITDQSFSSLVNSDNTESVKVEWSVVNGAGGYLFSLFVVDDPDNPVTLVKDSIVDGSSMVFPKYEDTKYELRVKALGNEKLNNTEAPEATIFEYSTLIRAVKVPEGQDIAEFINANLESSNDEQAFELEAGKTYTLNGLVDFKLNWITFRGDKVNRPTVIVGAAGGIVTQAGLKVKYIDFDCSAMTGTALLNLGTDPDPSTLSADEKYNLIHEPIILQDCNVKGISKSLFYTSGKNWAPKEVRISSCIIHINSTNSAAIINCTGGRGAIKDLKVMNSTFYNLVDNSSGRFAQYSSASNAQPGKFGYTDVTGSIYLMNNTFYKVMSKKEFGNNLPNINTVTVTLQKNIFYDCFRIQKAVGGNTTKNIANNILYAVSETLDNTDKTYGTEEDPKFVGPVNVDPAAVDFTPTGSKTVALQAGDPRWYE